MNQVAISEPKKSEAEVQLSTKNNVLLQQAQALTIETAEDCQKAADFAKAVAVQIKRVEDERKNMVKPFNDGVKAINARFAAYREPLEAANKEIRDKIQEFVELEAATRKEEEDRQREEARQEAEKLARESESAPEGVTTAPAPADASDDRSLPVRDDHVLQPHDLTITAPRATPVQVRGDSGAVVSQKETWTYEVTDILKLAELHPDAVQPNHTVIMHCIKNGVRTMPGLRIFTKSSIQIR